MSQITGSIDYIRGIEDSIRETKQYTEGLLSDRHTHPAQGEDGSKAFTKKYELYIDAPLHSMNILKWMDENESNVFQWFDGRAVIFKFWYDYREMKANCRVNDEGLKLACEKFPCINYAVTGEMPVVIVENAPVIDTKQETVFDRIKNKIMTFVGA